MVKRRYPFNKEEEEEEDMEERMEEKMRKAGLLDAKSSLDILSNLLNSLWVFRILSIPLDIIIPPFVTYSDYNQSFIE